MQVDRIGMPAIGTRAKFVRLPTAKRAVFAELLPTEAVRRVPANSTLYSVSYRRLKKESAVKKSAKKHAPTKKLLKGKGKEVVDTDVGGPLILTLYQSDLRAKKFTVLFKMMVDARLTDDEYAFHFGVSVAVDEVAECVYAVYTRDEPPVGRQPAKNTRLLLRRVKLTLAAADARGVRRLQRPGRGKPPSVIFEAARYIGVDQDGLPFKFDLKLNQVPRVVVLQLSLDGAALLLCVYNVDKSVSVGRLQLSEKRTSMNLRFLSDSRNALVTGNSQHKYVLRHCGKSLSEMRKRPGWWDTLPYTWAPALLDVGPVADAASSKLRALLRCEPASVAQLVGGKRSIDTWCPLGCYRGRQIIFCRFANEPFASVLFVATDSLQTPIVSVRDAQLGGGLLRHQYWHMRRTTSCQLFGKWLLALVVDRNARCSSPAKLVVLRATLAPPTFCTAKHSDKEEPTGSSRKKVCKVCLELGFTEYSWLLGCHFCSVACLRNAWPKHSRLHRMPPLKDWTDDDWERWRRDKSKP